jgi:hypothetical protein
VPKDKSLIRIAKKLGISATPLILAAHQQKLPGNAASYVLKPGDPGVKDNRTWPFSQAQCGYLAQILSSGEIQLIRKHRQLSADGKICVQSYIEYMFSLHRVPPPSSPERSYDQTQAQSQAR